MHGRQYASQSACHYNSLAWKRRSWEVCSLLWTFSLQPLFVCSSPLLYVLGRRNWFWNTLLSILKALLRVWLVTWDSMHACYCSVLFLYIYSPRSLPGTGPTHLGLVFLPQLVWSWSSPTGMARGMSFWRC